jgi:hypothetical protein
VSKKFTAMALAGLILAGGCDYWLTKPSMYGVIPVSVVGNDGTPIRGAQLALYTPQRVMGYGVTDASGHYVFTSVPVDNYGVFVTRPIGYRDFLTQGDSTYSFHDGIVLTPGARDSVSFVLSKCAGTVIVAAHDSTGAPVADVTAELYSSSALLGSAKTASDGLADLENAPCANSLGVRINAPAGYHLGEGRDSSFVDGLLVKNGDTLHVGFVLPHG